MIELTIKSRTEEKSPGLINVEKITRGAIWAIYNMLQKRSGLWYPGAQPITLSEKIDEYETEVSIILLNREADLPHVHMTTCFVEKQPSTVADCDHTDCARSYDCGRAKSKETAPLPQKMARCPHCKITFEVGTSFGIDSLSCPACHAIFEYNEANLYFPTTTCSKEDSSKNPIAAPKKIKLRASYMLTLEAHKALAIEGKGVPLDHSVEFEADMETAISEGVAIVTREGEIKQNMSLLGELLSGEALTNHNWASGSLIWKKTDRLDRILTPDEAAARYVLTINARRTMREKIKARRKLLRESLDAFIRKILGGEGEIPTTHKECSSGFFLINDDVAFDDEAKEIMTTEEDGLIRNEAHRRIAIAEAKKEIEKAQERIRNKQNERESAIWNFENMVTERKVKEAKQG
jgi:hypothetical protein